MTLSFNNIFGKSFQLEIKDETNNNFQTKVNLIINEIITKKERKKLSGIKLNIFITKNIKEKIYKYAEKEDLEYYEKNGFQEPKGNVTLPKIEKPRDYVIIFKESIFTDFDFYSTVTHEITHIIDYNNYSFRYGNIYLFNEHLKRQNYYYEFYLWTEFNAKKKGIYRLQEELNRHQYGINLKKTTKDFIENVENQNNKLEKLYELMHFLARISVYDNGEITSDEEIYPISFLKHNFGKNVTLLYSLMKEIETFDNFENEKSIMRYLIND